MNRPRSFLLYSFCRFGRGASPPTCTLRAGRPLWWRAVPRGIGKLVVCQFWCSASGRGVGLGPWVSGVTGGFLYKLGVVSYTIRILMYPACILHVSCMYFDVSYQDTSRYIKIHQDTFVSVTLAMMMASKHSDNPRDMYPACIPHVSRMYLACVEHVS